MSVWQTHSNTPAMLLKPEIPQQVLVKLKAGQQKQDEHYDKTSQATVPLEQLPGRTTWSLGVCKNQMAPRSYLVECNSTVYQCNRQRIRKANTTSSLSQNAVTWGDLNSDGEEKKRQETSSTDKQNINNFAAEPLPSVTPYFIIWSSPQANKVLYRAGRDLAYGTELFL